MSSRPGNHCVVHHVPDTVVKNLKELETEEIKAWERKIALDYLHSSNADLVRGDVVVFDAYAGYRNNGKAIYDGSKIVELDYEIDDYGSLPRQFQVIVDSIPLDYWSDDNINGGVIGIDHNFIVWFPYHKVLPELLDSATYRFDNNIDMFVIDAFFTYEGKKYRMIYDYGDDYETKEQNELVDGKDVESALLKFTLELQNDVERELLYKNEFYPTLKDTLFMGYL